MFKMRDGFLLLMAGLILCVTFLYNLDIHRKILSWHQDQLHNISRHQDQLHNISRHQDHLHNISRLDTNFTYVIFGQQKHDNPYVIPNPDKSYVSSSAQRITLARGLGQRRLGNQLFVFATLYGIARRNHITPTINIPPNKQSHVLLKIFEVPIMQDPKPIPKKLKKFSEAEFGKYDKRTETIGKDNSSISLSGYFQSWKYFKDVEPELRKQLTFTPEVQDRVNQYLAKLIPKEFQGKDYTRVGIHIRRGDLLIKHHISSGYGTAPAQYIFKAMEYFKKLYKQVIFIACSDDMSWTKKNIKAKNVFHSTANDVFLDFTVLSSMDHMIITVGTFGWWAAWLANGTTVYYKLPYRPGSKLGDRFSHEDYYPPHWLPMV